MIDRIRLLRNVGQFDSVDCASVPFSKLTLVYAENGRGKTTLAAIMRSLATGDPVPINERRRLATSNEPHVVIDPAGGSSVVFQNGGWTQSLPNVIVFDDLFVDQNIYSGLMVGTEHRQNLHELIIGSQGVTLNRTVQQHITRIEEHNRSLRTKGEVISVADRGPLSIDDFCSLNNRPEIDAEIQSAERNLAAAREQEAIQKASLFDILELQDFNISQIEALLQRDLGNLDAAAVARVQEHLARIGPRGEQWVSDGMQCLSKTGSQICPFCAQDLTSSGIVDHYRAYFSAEYEALKKAIADTLADIDARHGGHIPAAFERGVRVWSERTIFWSKFCDVPTVSLDTAAIARAWNAAREAIISVLRTKQSSPLEQITLPEDTKVAVRDFDSYRQQIHALSQELQQSNHGIGVVKEQAASGNVSALAADVARLKAVRARYAPSASALCTEYLTEKAAKATTEQMRDTAKSALAHYRETVFPAYQTAINVYLQRFNAGFRIDTVSPVDTRGGASCTYNVLINNVAIPVGGGNPAPGAASFRNTLSAGDRSTLALAFFFAARDQDPDMDNRVVVIDDPITSSPWCKLLRLSSCR